MYQNRYPGPATGQPAAPAPVSAQAKSLEQTRQRYLLVESLLRDLLAQIENPASSTAAGRETSAGMASWPTLLRSLKIITPALTDVMTSSFPPTGNQTFLDPGTSHPQSQPQQPTTLSVPLNANIPLHVYPQNTFPGRTQENILTLLLRKKWTPAVSSWADAALEMDEKGVVALTTGTTGMGNAADKGLGKMTAPRTGVGLTSSTTAGHNVTLQDLVDLWEWAGPAGNAVAQKVLLEESEGEDDDDDDDEDGDEPGDGDGQAADGRTGNADSEMVDVNAVSTSKSPVAQQQQQDSRPAVAIDDVMRFMYIGITPS